MVYHINIIAYLLSQVAVIDNSQTGEFHDVIALWRYAEVSDGGGREKTSDRSKKMREYRIHFKFEINRLKLINVSFSVIFIYPLSSTAYWFRVARGKLPKYVFLIVLNIYVENILRKIIIIQRLNRK